MSFLNVVRPLTPFHMSTQRRRANPDIDLSQSSAIFWKTPRTVLATSEDVDLDGCYQRIGMTLGLGRDTYLKYLIILSRLSTFLAAVLAMVAQLLRAVLTALSSEPLQSEFTMVRRARV